MLERKEGCEIFGWESQSPTVVRKFGETSRQCGLMLSDHISYSGWGLD